jgi:hypothetical protein
VKIIAIVIAAVAGLALIETLALQANHRLFRQAPEVSRGLGLV